MHAVRVQPCPVEAQRATPVVGHEDDLAQVEGVDESPDDSGVELEGVRKARGFVRLAKAQQVQGNAPSAGPLGHVGQHVAPQIRGRWVSVHE